MAVLGLNNLKTESSGARLVQTPLKLGFNDFDLLQQASATLQGLPLHGELTSCISPQHQNQLCSGMPCFPQTARPL